MKCTSLWQPWATLIEIGAKVLETRGRLTHVRGTIGIHAGMLWTVELRSIASSAVFRAALKAGGYDPASSALLRRGRALPMGAIVCVADLVGCEQITAENAPPEPERTFGNYTPGRFMWRLANVRPLTEPLAWKGKQGWFDVPDELIMPRLAGERAA